ncbi:MAG: hypothetical protein HY040_05485 [Planctomycetes bacterium]|nr:hypothetical protein [Planctomycetota bacterium]
MDELALLRLMGIGSSSGIDITALIAFFAIAVIYFLAPVVGYRFQRPASMALALYLLVVHFGFSVIQMVFQWLQFLGGPAGRGGGIFGGGPGLGGGDPMTFHISFLISILKTMVFLVAILSFVIGLQSLRLRPYQSESETSRD